MKKTIGEYLFMIGIWAFVIILVAAVLTSIGFTIAAYTMYGNTPISEVPAWAFWFMGGGRR